MTSIPLPWASEEPPETWPQALERFHRLESQKLEDDTRRVAHIEATLRAARHDQSRQVEAVAALESAVEAARATQPTGPMTDFDQMEIFGRRLRLLRELLGMPREQFATALDVSVPTIQNWEGGTKRISPSNLRKVAKAVGLPPEALWPAQVPDGDRDARARSPLRQARGRAGDQPTLAEGQVETLMTRVAELEAKIARLEMRPEAFSDLEGELAQEVQRVERQDAAGERAQPSRRRRAQG